MVAVSRLVVQLLCLLSYLWTSTCLGNVLLINQLVQQDPYPNIIMIDEASDLLTVHHKGHRDQHEPQAQNKMRRRTEKKNKNMKRVVNMNMAITLLKLYVLTINHRD